MVKKKVKEAINFFKQQLKNEGLNISKIILFGSQANRTATEESDIDLVVVSEDFSGKDIFERAKLLSKVDVMTIKKFMIPLDVIMMSPEDFESETSIIAAYARQGTVVYERINEKANRRIQPHVVQKGRGK